MLMREDAQAPAAFTRARRTDTCLYRREGGVRRGREGEGKGREGKGGLGKGREGCVSYVLVVSVRVLVGEATDVMCILVLTVSGV
jgi:hypothetical protein